MFEKLVDWWLSPEILGDKIPDEVDVLAPLSYGATESGLTPAGAEIARVTLSMIPAFPTAQVVYGAVKNGVKPEREMAIKRVLFGPHAAFAGFLANKIEEAREFRRATIAALGREPKVVVVISGEIHGGRGTRYLFQKEFPQSIIVNRFVPWQKEIGPTHGFLSQNKWVWLAVNVGWYLVLRFPFDLGYKFLSQIEGMKHQH